jgi:diguanylate cyclase (GGDEF)-like protein
LLETQELSVHDSLTGCLNRKPAMELLETELRRARRSGQPLSVLMLDVDEFKQVNDRRGHLCGDAVLRTIGRHLAHSLRSSDVKCRYGGDEFILILPDTPFEGAEHVASTISRAIAAQRIEHDGPAPLTVTVSIGIAMAKLEDADSQAVIDRADRALYDAKRSGRNRWSGSAA